MEKHPEKFLYIYLQDMNTNPKLCFELHRGPLPEGGRGYAKAVFPSLDKETVLENVRAVENIGFTVLITTLLESCLKQGRPMAMLVYLFKGKKEEAIYMDEEPYREHEGGELYTFLPLRPFETHPEKLSSKENMHDTLLQMRTGRIVANALL